MSTFHRTPLKVPIEHCSTLYSSEEIRDQLQHVNKGHARVLEAVLGWLLSPQIAPKYRELHRNCIKLPLLKKTTFNVILKYT